MKNQGSAIFVIVLATTLFGCHGRSESDAPVTAGSNLESATLKSSRSKQPSVSSAPAQPTISATPKQPILSADGSSAKPTQAQEADLSSSATSSPKSPVLAHADAASIIQSSVTRFKVQRVSVASRQTTLFRVIYADSKFIISGDLATVVVGALEGQNIRWKKQNFPTSYANLYGLVRTPSGYLAADSSGFLYRSRDAQSWSEGQYLLEAMGPSEKSVRSGAAAPAGVVSLASNAGTVVATTLLDKVIVTANSTSSPSESPWKESRIALGRTLIENRILGVSSLGAQGFVLFGGARSLKLSRDQGISWFESNAFIENGMIRAVASGGNQLIAVGNDPHGAVIARSLDGGKTWVHLTDSLEFSLRGSSLSTVSYTGQEFIAAGPQGLLLSSADGVNWIRHQGMPEDVYPSDLAFASSGALKGRLVVVGGNGTVLILSE